MKKLKYFLCLMIVAIFGFTLVGCNPKPNDSYELISKESAETMVLDGLDATYELNHPTDATKTASGKEYLHRNIFDCFKRAKFEESIKVEGSKYLEEDQGTGIIVMENERIKEYFSSFSLKAGDVVEGKEIPTSSFEYYTPDGEDFYEYSLNSNAIVNNGQLTDENLDNFRYYYLVNDLFVDNGFEKLYQKDVKYYKNENKLVFNISLFEYCDYMWGEGEGARVKQMMEEDPHSNEVYSKLQPTLTILFNSDKTIKSLTIFCDGNLIVKQPIVENNTAVDYDEFEEYFSFGVTITPTDEQITLNDDFRQELDNLKQQ